MDLNINQIIQGWLVKEPLTLVENILVRESKFKKYFDAPATYSYLKDNGGFALTRKIKLRSIYISDTSKYDRDKGYTKGSVAFDSVEYQMRWDLSKEYFMDKMDLNDVGFTSDEFVSKVYQKYVREKLVPAADKIIITEICEKANLMNAELSNVQTWDSTNDEDAYNQWRKAKIHIEETFRENDGQTHVFMTEAFLQAIIADKRFIKASLVDTVSSTVDSVTGKRIDTRIREIDGHPIIIVPQDKMITKFIYNDAVDTASTPRERINERTFTPAPDAKTAHLLITRFKNSTFVNLLAEVKYIPNGQNQLASGEGLAMRDFMDMIITREEHRNIYLVEKAGIRDIVIADIEKPQIDNNTTPRDHLNNFATSTMELPTSKTLKKTVLDAELNVAPSDVAKAAELLEKQESLKAAYTSTVKALEELIIDPETAAKTEKALETEK